MSTAPVSQNWQPTACILCSINCGLEMQTDGAKILRIRGDERHPRSQGYLCQKAARLDFYQNHADRLDAPLRRRRSHRRTSRAANGSSAKRKSTK